MPTHLEVSMTRPSRQPSPNEKGITQLSIEGHKSLRTHQDIEIRPLTIIAGINISGKSSAMQPLLLIKQALDAAYDPDPLQLNGPHVSITAIDQILSKTGTKRSRAKMFRAGFRINGYDLEVSFGKSEKGDLQVLEMTGIFFPEQKNPVTLRRRHGRITDR
jgi:predicted ATPase